jgi:alpha-1,2-mannosyltransferase
LPFTYPPFALLAFLPTTVLPARAGFLMLTVLSAILLFAVVFAVLKALGVTGIVRPGLIAIAVQLLAAATDPVRSTLGYGQVNIVLMAMVALDCLATSRRWPRGLLVGLAAAIKLTPAVFVLFFLLRKDYRAALRAGLAFVATAALAFVLMPGPSVAYWTELVFSRDRIGAPEHVANQSLRGALARLSPDIGAVPWLLAVLVILALTVVAVRRAAGNAPFALAVIGMCGLLVSPVSWVHHWVWLVPLLVVVGRTAVAERRIVAGLSVLAAAVVAVVTPIWQVDFDHWRDGPWQQAISDSYVLAGIMVMVVAAVCAGGSSTTTSSPPEGSANARTDPLWAPATERTIDNPSPEPPEDDVRSRSSRRNGSNSPATASGGTTGPVLTTRTAGDPPTVTSTDPPRSL